MYRSAIVDELGCVKYWCDQLTTCEGQNLLNNHPEWRLEYIEVE